MTKVDCLKELYTKLTGKTVDDVNVDTVCECIRLLGDALESGVVGKIENLSKQVTVEASNENITISNAVIGLQKSANVYSMSLMIMFNLTTEITNNIIRPFDINIPEMKNFFGCTSPCVLMSPSTGTSVPGTFQIEAPTNGVCKSSAYMSTSGIGAGSYTFFTTVTFIG